LTARTCECIEERYLPWRRAQEAVEAERGQSRGRQKKDMTSLEN